MTHVLLVDGGEKQPPAEKALRSAEGFTVDRLRQAETVLEEAEDLFSENGRSGPDLLVTGWFLPQLNGPALAEKLREAGMSVPILLLASRGGAEARAEALRRGADDCLTRPAHPEELTARLEALRRRPSEWEQVRRLQAGPLQMDASRTEARAYGRALDLREKEFFFLYLLIDRRPAVVSREMLTTRVWGRGHVSENSIDVTASGLRRKLEGALLKASLKNGSADGKRRPHMETIRGVGYRLSLGPERPKPTGEA